MNATLFHADHVFPGDAPPIVGGGVLVASRGHAQPEGTVLDVGQATELEARHATATVHRIRGILLPGLVNAHTHLELSALRDKIPGGRGFVPWVQSLLATRDIVLPEDDTNAIDTAARELAAFGTVAVGDVTNSLAAVSALARHNIGGSVFHEVFGQDRDEVLGRVARLDEARQRKLPSWPSRDLAYAPAPHTLYMTHPDAIRALLKGARSLGARTSLHLAEHGAERRAVENDDGPVPEWLAALMGHAAEFPKKPLFDFANQLEAIAADVLLVHMTDARPDELQRVAAAKAPIVLCPRSNLHIEGRLPPFLSIREVGINAALGTDSLASCPSLDVLAEAKALAENFPSVPAWQLVSMATYNGARALGRGDLGRFAKGTRPGVIHVEADVTGDPASYLLGHLHLARRMLVPRMPSRLP